MRFSIKRPALRYYGGKWRMAKNILAHFPTHNVYVEPFFGGGSVLLKKRRAKLETVNDLDDLVVNYFQVLRDNPDELIRLLKLTPWSRTELSKDPRQAITTLEKARLFFLRSWATIAQRESSWSFRVCKTLNAMPANIMLELDYLYAVSDRLLGVQIENMDAIDFIKKYAVKNSVVYLDPPYLKKTRRSSNEYYMECSDDFHVQLIESVLDLDAYVVLSGYRSKLYDQFLSNWKRVDFKALCNSASSKTESLWVNKKTENTIYGLTLFS